MFFDFLSGDDRKPVIILKIGRKKKIFLRIIPVVDANVFKLTRLLSRYKICIFSLMFMFAFFSVCVYVLDISFLILYHSLASLWSRGPLSSTCVRDPHAPYFSSTCYIEESIHSVTHCL